MDKRRDAQAQQALAAETLRDIRYMSHPSSYFLWLPLAEEARADRITMALVREHISVSTAEPFATSLHVPHAIWLALGSVDMQALESALKRVASVVAFHS